MRINKFIAMSTGLSRRAADAAIEAGRVLLNGQAPSAGSQVTPEDTVQLDGKTLAVTSTTTTIMLNKPFGYVCSRDGQGSETIYDLLPADYQELKSVGRLDKNSSGLLLLTNDGQLAQRLTHPSFEKVKIYQVTLDKPLTDNDKKAIDQGVQLRDGMSRLQVTVNRGWDNTATGNRSTVTYTVSMHEGRNRQIRRTFESLGYTVRKLHRTHFGTYILGDLASGATMIIAS